MKQTVQLLVMQWLVFSTAFLLSNAIQAQSTAQQVEAIITAKCASCHSAGGGYTGGPDLSVTGVDLYDALVNVVPNNAEAAARGDKYIDPGYPYRSYLMRKINNGLMDAIDAPLGATEGTIMPPPGSGIDPLTNSELELLRQWIYAGAPLNGNVVDMDVIDTYYNEGGYQLLDRPEPPPANLGYQIHLGPIFMDTGQEEEYLKKHEVRNDSPVEVNRMEVIMNEQSHHFIMYKFDSAGDANGVNEGLRSVSLFGENPFSGNNGIVSTWTFSDDFRLPAGTAYFWDSNTVLDLNYHIPNYSTNNILPADVYINVYTQATGTAVKEMKSDLLLYSPFSLFIPPGGQDFTDDIGNNQQWNIWWLSSHTHQLGSDFDVFVQGGEQLYEGHYDYTNCDCNVGYYDWSHPPVRIFEPMYELNAGVGLRQEASFNNPSSNTVTFGLTTNDEMMITVIQYTEGTPVPYVGVPNIQDVYCLGDAPITFEPSGGTISGPGTSGESFTPANAGLGTHTINYTAQGITATYQIDVTDGPQPSITYEEATDQLATDIGLNSYQWYENGNPIAGGVGPFLANPTLGNTYTVQVSDSNCSGTSQPFEYAATIPSITVSVMVNLEGVYDATASTMLTPLMDAGIVPIEQPYNRPPWSYTGTEMVAASNMPSNLVDWVLVELRAANDRNVLIETRAGLLLADGRIADAADSTLDLRFYDATENEDYFIVVRHRNHLAVMSNDLVTIPNSTTYDFRSGNTWGGDYQQQELNLGLYGLYAGDANSNGIINYTDFNAYTLDLSVGGNGNYLDGDFNLDTEVSTTDFNTLFPNARIIGMEEIRY